MSKKQPHSENTRLRILFVCHSQLPYGAERRLVEITKYLDRSKFEVFVALPKNCEYASSFLDYGVKIVEMKAQSHKFSWKNLGSILKYNFDLIQCCKLNSINIAHFNLTAHIECLLLFYLWAFFYGRKVFFHLRCPFDFSAFERWLLSSHYCVCVSEAIRNQLFKSRRSDLFVHFDSKRAQALHNGYELDRFFCRTEIDTHLRSSFASSDENIVGIVAAIDPIKRIDLFIHTAKKILQKAPKTKFLIIGDIRGETEELILYKQQQKQLCNELGLNANVYFLGFRSDVPELYSVMDVFLLTSQRETLGGVLVEAMASGKAVVSSAVDGTVEVIEHGVTGLLIHSNDSTAYAEAVLKLLNDLDLRHKYGTAGRKRAETMFDIHKQILKLQEIYFSSIT